MRKVEVEGTESCPVCGKWNAVVHFTNGKEEWNCLEQCHTLENRVFEVFRIGSRIEVFTAGENLWGGKLLGTITAKTLNHANYIQGLVLKDYQTKKRSTRQGWSKAK